MIRTVGKSSIAATAALCLLLAVAAFLHAGAARADECPIDGPLAGTPAGEKLCQKPGSSPSPSPDTAPPPKNKKKATTTKREPSQRAQTQGRLALPPPVPFPLPANLPAVIAIPSVPPPARLPARAPSFPSPAVDSFDAGSQYFATGPGLPQRPGEGGFSGLRGILMLLASSAGALALHQARVRRSMIGI